MVTATYLTGERPGLPAVSLALEPDDFLGATRGIYATGPDASQYPPYRGANFWRTWERAADFTFIETNGLPVFQSGAGWIHGGYSRSARQKSFRLYARRKYGAGAFEHAFFPDLALDRFEALLLRNGGNDWPMARMRDELGQGLGGELGADFSHARPVVVYLNGQYWGLYTLLERPDQDVASHHDVDPDALDMMENGAESAEGDQRAYVQLLQGLPGP